MLQEIAAKGGKLRMLNGNITLSIRTVERIGLITIEHAGSGSDFTVQPPSAIKGRRLTAATRAAENGATEKMLMAIYGWTTMEQAAYYTEKANRKKLAKQGMEFLRPEGDIGHNGGPKLEQTEDRFVLPMFLMAKSGTKTPK